LVTCINEESFVYKKKKEGEANQSLPRWVLLNPDTTPQIKGKDMLCGVQHGFFGPTNVENAGGAPKY
jgi:hypothetical protein